MEEICFGGFTESELKIAFKKVRNADDWRAPIDAPKVARANVRAAVAAIRFFTATEPVVCAHGDFASIYSEGYRMGPAGP